MLPETHCQRLAAEPRADTSALPAPIDAKAFAALADPLAGLGAVPLHLHRTMHDHAPINRVAVRLLNGLS